MSDRITDTITEALGQHRLEKGMRISADPDERIEWWYCVECGWESEMFELGSTVAESAKREHQAAAIVAALRADNIALVELPEVAYKGFGHTDAEYFKQAADRMEDPTKSINYLGGSNVRRAVRKLLYRAADAAEEK